MLRISRSNKRERSLDTRHFLIAENKQTINHSIILASFARFEIEIDVACVGLRGWCSSMYKGSKRFSSLRTTGRFNLLNDLHRLLALNMTDI